MSLDLSAPIRAALLARADVATALSTYVGEPAVFTQRPVPADAGYPFALVNPDAAIGDADWLTARFPIVQRDVGIYGQNVSVKAYRAAERAAYAVRDLFHRQKSSITVPGYQVLEIRASGPIPGPTDDQQVIARVIGLTIELRRQA